MRFGLSVRLVLPFAIAGLACVQTNPEFDPPETGDSGSDEVGVDTDTGGALCPLQPAGAELVIDVPPTCGENSPDDTFYERLILVNDTGKNDITGFSCTDMLCGPDTCKGPVPATVTVSPLPIGDLVVPGDCIYLRASRRVPEDTCAYEAIAIWRNQEPEPIIVARSSNAELPARDGSTTSGIDLHPGTDEIDSCNCTLYPGSCCNGTSDPPTNYALTVGGMSVMPPDGIGTVTLDNLEYSFYAIHAFNPGGCDEPDRLAWGITRP